MKIKPFICKRCRKLCDAIGGLISDCCKAAVIFRESKKEEKKKIPYGL